MKILRGDVIEDIVQSSIALLNGNLVAFPTETVYGLGSDACNPVALKRIFQVKNRPANHPLIVHLSSKYQMKYWCKSIPDYGVKLVDEFWPGPMTLILPKSDLANDLVTGNQRTVALRVPSDRIANLLLCEFESLGGLGVAAPSANLFGQVSATNSSIVNNAIGRRLIVGDVILDGGKTTIGIESTIIDCTGAIPRILRPGFITQKMVEKLLGINLSNNENLDVPKYSGQFKSHYSPKAKVKVGGPYEYGAGFIALDSFSTPKSLIRLCTPSDNKLYASQLYESFAKADELKLGTVHVILAQGDDIAVAINDRILKASYSLNS